MELRTRASLGSMIALIAILAGPCIAYAQSLDPHRLYEERCAKCHAPHAGDFVHDSLVPTGGKVIGRMTSKELGSFLSEGHGNLDPLEIDAIVEHLTSIQKSGRLFHNKCLICHDRAVALARAKLVISNGRLQGRYSGRDIEKFLSNHGRLEEEEVTAMIQVLKRQLTEDQILKPRQGRSTIERDRIHFGKRRLVGSVSSRGSFVSKTLPDHHQPYIKVIRQKCVSRTEH